MKRVPASIDGRDIAEDGFYDLVDFNDYYELSEGSHTTLIGNRGGVILRIQWMYGDNRVKVSALFADDATEQDKKKAEECLEELAKDFRSPNQEQGAGYEFPYAVVDWCRYKIECSFYWFDNDEE